jgi:hypothetical protein
MRSSQLLPLSGAASVVLIVVSFLIAGEPPDVDDAPGELLDYYTDDSLQWGAALLALGSLFFLVFSATLASVLRAAVRDIGSTAAKVSFAGGIVFTVGLTIFSGLAFTAGEVADDVEIGTLQTLNALEMNMFFTVAVGTAAFLLGSGIGVLKTGVLPRWMGWVAIVLGVLAITPVGFAAFIGLGIWTLVASVMLAMRAEAEPRAAGDAA